MTASREGVRRVPLSAILGFLLLCALLIFARDVIPWMQKGLLLCGKTIIPTLFPCMVACDMLFSGVNTPPRARRSGASLWRFLFKIPSIGMLAFLLGALCGFPIGTKIVAELHHGRALNREECENLLCFSNNTGPAFAVAGVGISLFGSIRVGILLYVIQLIAALFCGIVFSLIPHESSNEVANDKTASQRTSGFAEAVQRSVGGILNVCGFIMIFSAICGVFSSFVKNPILLGFIYSFLEVGGACGAAASLFFDHPIIAILCATLAINFGGLSVHLQSRSLLVGVSYSFSRYLAAKLTQAAVAVLLSLLCMPLFGIWG